MVLNWKIIMLPQKWVNFGLNTNESGKTDCFYLSKFLFVADFDV